MACARWRVSFHACMYVCICVCVRTDIAHKIMHTCMLAQPTNQPPPQSIHLPSNSSSTPHPSTTPVFQVFRVSDPQWACALSEGSSGVSAALWAPDARHVLTVCVGEKGIPCVDIDDSRRKRGGRGHPKPIYTPVSFPTKHTTHTHANKKTQTNPQKKLQQVTDFGLALNGLADPNTHTHTHTHIPGSSLHMFPRHIFEIFQDLTVAEIKW